MCAFGWLAQNVTNETLAEIHQPALVALRIFSRASSLLVVAARMPRKNAISRQED
jgi:hypothetical protein